MPRHAVWVPHQAIRSPRRRSGLVGSGAVRLDGRQDGDPDDWIEGDDYVGPMLGISTSEPRFCPWCGDALGRAHELIRGWDGKTGILTKEDFL